VQIVNNSQTLENTQTRALATKEATETAVFSLYSTTSWRNLLLNTPLQFFLMPFIGIGLLINGAAESYSLYKARNRSFDAILNTLVANISAILGGIAITGSLSFFALNLGAFALGPYCFAGGMLLGGTHQFYNTFLHLIRAFKAPPDSEERQSLQQKAFHHGFNTILVGVTVALIFALFLSPAGPAAILGLSIAATGFTLISLGWKVMPSSIKEPLKIRVGFTQPEEQSLSQTITPQSKITSASFEEKATEVAVKSAQTKVEKRQLQFFSCAFRRYEVESLIKNKGQETAKKFLLEEINRKIKNYDNKDDKKSTDKKGLLKALRNDFIKDETVDKAKLLIDYPQALQSMAFLSGKGDMEDLLEAIDYYQSQEFEHSPMPATRAGITPKAG
jgi:hypothetical protein